MPVPLVTCIHPVILHDVDGNPITALNPLPVTGTITVVVGPPIPTTDSGQQTLGAGPLNLSSAQPGPWSPRFVTLSFDMPLVAPETLSITLLNALGAPYNVLVEKVTLAPAASAAAQAYVFAFPPDFPLAAGDQINVALTNTGGVETATVSAVIRGEK